MLRQLVIFAAIAAAGLLLARTIPGDNTIARTVRYCLYVVSIGAACVLVWIVLAATVFESA